MESVAIVLGVLLYGGIWLAWGRRTAGLAMVGTVALAALVSGGIFGYAAWQAAAQERAAAERRAAAAAEEQRTAEERATCRTEGRRWLAGEPRLSSDRSVEAAFDAAFGPLGRCETDEELAVRTAREEEEVRKDAERRLQKAERTEALERQLAAQMRADAEKAKTAREFRAWSDAVLREALIDLGGSEGAAWRRIGSDVARRCGQLGGTPIKTGYTVSCNF